MMGMEMMFKALGLDPEVILKSAEDFKQGLAKLNADLEFIKQQNQQILNALVPAIPAEVIGAPGDVVPCDEHGHVFGRALNGG